MRSFNVHDHISNQYGGRFKLQERIRGVTWVTFGDHFKGIKKQLKRGKNKFSISDSFMQDAAFKYKLAFLKV